MTLGNKALGIGVSLLRPTDRACEPEARQKEHWCDGKQRINLAGEGGGRVRSEKSAFQLSVNLAEAAEECQAGIEAEETPSDPFLQELPTPQPSHSRPCHPLPVQPTTPPITTKHQHSPRTRTVQDQDF